MLNGITSRLAAPARLAGGFLIRLANRRSIFTITVVSILTAKICHILSHLSAVPTRELWVWGYSLFAQDISLLIFIRLLLDHWVAALTNTFRAIVTFLASVLIVYNAGISIVSVSFYIVSGSEIHWRNIAVAGDATSRAILLSGLISFILVIAVTFFLGWLLQDVCYSVFGYAADIVNWPFSACLRCTSRSTRMRVWYDQVPQGDVEFSSKQGLLDDDESSASSDSGSRSSRSDLSLPLRLLQRALESAGFSAPPSRLAQIMNILSYAAVGLALFLLFAMALLRPSDGAMPFMSWTAALLPLVDISSGSVLYHLESQYGTGIQQQWDQRTALTKPRPWDWLPKANDFAGFEDWRTGDYHYNADADPMRINNLDQPLHAELREKLKDVSIQHVMIFLLESTRHDVFPIKKDGLIWNRLANSFPDKKIPQAAQDRIANLTPTANYITGDYDDGFEHDEETRQKKRGGIHFKNAHTAATYTLKSMVGTLCGLSPVLADFNWEYEHHIYQPCLPQIFEALNQLDPSGENAEKWKSYFFQTATLDYDNHNKLMEDIGFPLENTIDREYLRSDSAKHGPVTLPNINAFAFEEDPLEDYIRDAFVSAQENDERVFLTHITTTSHHAWDMPKKEKYVEMGKDLRDLSHYVNAEGYDDKWVRKVLNLLDDVGVANETLVIFLGDHGISMPENDILSPYYNPSIGIDHVPLVFSHPSMPAFSVDDAVHATQVLPTILDLLLETGSLNSASEKAVKDLVQNYESQSLIRPLQTTNETTGQGQWQYTLVNPGRALVTVRDARYPERHMAVPIIDNVEWRLSNITADPREEHAVQGFDFPSFMRGVEKEFGEDVAKWAEEGAFMSRWWVEENFKRWKFGAYGKGESGEKARGGGK